MFLIEWIQNNSKINSEISSEVGFFFILNELNTLMFKIFLSFINPVFMGFLEVFSLIL